MLTHAPPNRHTAALLSSLATAFVIGACATPAFAQQEPDDIPPFEQIDLLAPAEMGLHAPASTFNPPQALAPADEDDSEHIAAQRPAVIAALFRRSAFSRVTLSPDGKYLACVTRGPASRIVVAKADAPTEIVSVRSLPANPVLETSDNSVAADWLGWIAPDRLVAALNMPHRAVNGIARGEIVAMNADGSNNARLLTPKDVQKPGFLSSAETPASRQRASVPLGGDFPPYAEDTAEAGGTPGVSIDMDRMGITSDIGRMGVSSRPDGRGISNLASARAARAGRTGDSVGNAPFALSSGFSSGLRMPAARDQPLRSISVIGYSDDDPQSILVRAQSLLAYGVYKLNVITGKHANASEQIPADHANMLMDRQGRVAIEQPRTTDKRFPHDYRYRGGEARTADLDKIITRAPGAAAPTVNHKLETVNSRAPGAGFSVSPENVFGERSIPIGFDTDPSILYYASNVGRDTFGIYGYDLKKNAPTGLAIEDDTRDLFLPPITGFPQQPVLVWNRHTGRLAGIIVEGAPRTTRWLDPRFQELQQSLERRLPGRIVSLLEWSSDETKFLVHADGPADPGSYYVYDAPSKKLTAFARHSASLNEATMPIVSEIDMVAKDGVRLTGMITTPAEFLTKTIPVIVVCPAAPWERRLFEYRPETLMLAALGYMVVELNPRGAIGHGLKSRQSLPATPTVTHAADIIAIIDELSKHFPINQRRVSLLGEQYGGYIALRALQLHPGRFSCAVAIDAPVDPKKWLDEIKISTGESEPLLCASHYDTPEELKARPLVTRPQLIQKPIYVLNRHVMPRVDRDGISIIQPGEAKHDDARQLVDMVKSYNAKFPGMDSNDMESIFEPMGGNRAILYSNAEKFIRAVHTKARVIFGPIRVIGDPVIMR